MPDSPLPANRPVVAQPTPAPRESQRPAGSQLPLTVRYYRRMRPQRVYPVVVSCNTKGRVRSPEPVVLRLLMAGAQVVPSEHTLDPSQPKPRVTFYVTPLARGWLHGERLEVVQQGKKVQEVRLPSKVTTQRMTWILLALAILVPWLIVPCFSTSPLTTFDDPPRLTGGDGEAEDEGEPKQKKGKAPAGKAPKGKENAGEKGPPPGKDERVQLVAGRALEKILERNAPHVPTMIEDAWPDGATMLRDVRGHAGAAYDYGYYTVRNNNIPLAYYTVCFFLVLAALSWFMHTERQKRRVVRG